MSRDTWEGEAKRPISMNRWGYVEGNPVNLTDPSGHERCSNDINSRVAVAEKYVNRTNAGHLIRDDLNTYTAGGIGVQCYGTDIGYGDNTGLGLGQVTNKQVNQEYGVKIIVADDERGCGLSLPGEVAHDQKQPVWAVHYMRRRIQQVLDECDKCTSTDRFIAAGLAQNGPGFTHFDLTQTVLNTRPKNINDLYRYLTPDGKVDQSREDGVTADWSRYFVVRNNSKDTYDQLNLFAQVVFSLHANHSQSLGWYVPADLNWNTIWKLTKP